MTHVHDGQCGLCTHFGEHDTAVQTATEPKIVQIRQSHEAPEDLVEECGHPQLAPLHLLVTPMSGCNGFEPARV